MQTPTQTALQNLYDRYINLFQIQGQSAPKIMYDNEWLSPCIKGSKDENNLVSWHPVARTYLNPFTDMESALGMPFHPSVCEFYGSYWSEGMWGSTYELELSLIQVWNEDDLDMLKQNLLGHAFAKKKNRQDLTLFIGCTDTDDIVSIRNDDGSVIIEQPGKKHQKQLSPSLEDFLNAFQPSTRPYSPIE